MSHRRTRRLDGAAEPWVLFDALHQRVAVFDNPEWISTDSRAIRGLE
jgi:hypothetical protein